MEEDTGEEPFIRNEYPTEKLHEDFERMQVKITEENEEKRKKETMKIIKRGKETGEIDKKTHEELIKREINEINEIFIREILQILKNK